MTTCVWGGCPDYICTLHSGPVIRSVTLATDCLNLLAYMRELLQYSFEIRSMHDADGSCS